MIVYNEKNKSITQLLRVHVWGEMLKYSDFVSEEQYLNKCL